MSEFIDQVHALLKDGFGTSKQKAEVVRAAHDLDAAEGLQVEGLKKAFLAYVKSYAFLKKDHDPIEHLPDTSTKSDAQVAREYHLSQPSTITQKQAQLADARESRINRCADMILENWDIGACIAQVTAKDEWFKANERAEAYVEYSREAQ